MLKTGFRVFALIVPPLLLIWYFGILPGQADRAVNRVVRGDTALVISEEARALHETLLVIDLHADPLIWRRDLLQRLDHGHTDLPRLEEGNVGIQVFGSATKSPWGQNYDSNPSDSDMLTMLVIANLQPIATWTSLYERSAYHASRLAALESAVPGRFRVIRTAADLEVVVSSRAEDGAPVGGLLGLEGAHPLEGKLDNLDRLFDAGYRMIGMAHFFDNAVAGSMHGEEKYGLTPLGRDVVARAEELGMIIDLAHSSPAAVEDMLDRVTKPVVVSHGGVRATCQVNRNLDDRQIERIAANDGIIGIGYWDAAVCDDSPAGIVNAIDHVRKLVGVEHVGLGSDFDGGTTTRFDTSELAVITQELLAREYSEAEIRKVMGENALRVFRETLPQ